MYKPTPEQDRQRDNKYTYHPPHGDQIDRYADLRAVAKDFAVALECRCPPSRELSLAQTKIEEAVMWANAAIARNESAAAGGVP